LSGHNEPSPYTQRPFVFEGMAIVQRNRIVVTIGILALVLVAIFAWGLTRGTGETQPAPATPGSPAISSQAKTTSFGEGIPIYIQGQLKSTVLLKGMDALSLDRFVDDDEGLVREGPLLRDVLRQSLGDEPLPDDAVVTVMSTISNKTAELTWAEVKDPANHVVLIREEGQGLMLVSVLPQLDDRSEWVEGIDRIKIRLPIQ